MILTTLLCGGLATLTTILAVISTVFFGGGSVILATLACVIGIPVNITALLVGLAGAASVGALGSVILAALTGCLGIPTALLGCLGIPTTLFGGGLALLTALFTALLTALLGCLGIPATLLGGMLPKCGK